MDNVAEFQRLMGECLQRWQLVEHLSYLIFQHLAECRTERVGSLIYFATRGSDRKTDLLDTLACELLKDKQLAEWKALVSRIRAANKMRDRIAHFTVVAVADNEAQNYELWPTPHDVSNAGASAISKRVPVAALKRFIADTQQVSFDLNKFRLALWTTFGKPR